MLKVLEKKLGILLVNLGSPDAPTFDAVQKYLKEFLSDPRVVEINRIKWWFILNGIILNFRPGKSAEAYQKIWTGVGSPLIIKTKTLVAGLKQELSKEFDGFQVEAAMRYGNPSMKKGLENLKQAGCKKIIVLPLYPQYSAATTASTFDKLYDILKEWRYLPEISFLNSYHDHPVYIKGVAKSIADYWEKNGRAEKLLMSFHGLPKSSVYKGDPYYCECVKSAKLIAKELGLKREEWQFVFQSRFGKEEWLKPYTDKTIEAYGKQGLKSLDVVCPGFAIDCLETLEEIAMQNKEIFFESGGERFNYIPCLNDGEMQIELMLNLIRERV